MMIFIGIDRRDKIRNNYIRGTGQAEQFEDKRRRSVFSGRNMLSLIQVTSRSFPNLINSNLHINV